MTHPVPTPDNPIPSRPGPCVVPVKTCCGLLVGEECECLAFAAEVAAAFASPITFHFAGGLAVAEKYKEVTA